MTEQIEHERPPLDVKDTGEDPYPVYSRMREECPVGRVRNANGIEAYLVTRYEDARQALADPRLGKDPKHGAAMMAASGVPLPKPGATNLANHMLASDPPDHTRLRRLLVREFTPRRVEALRPRIQQLTDELADRVESRVAAGEDVVDLVAEFAFPLPMSVISELLGVPLADLQKFRRWGRAILLPLGTPGQAEGLQELSGYLAELLAAKKADPGDDLFSALAVAQDEDRLSPQELIGTAILLIIAGHDTTVNLIANGTLALLRHPDQLAELRRRRELLPDAIEEFLRYDAPLERATARWATEDLEIAGTAVPKGSLVSVVLGSANRDTCAFAGGEDFDISRPTRDVENRHIAFGHGLHFCVGAPLARLEGLIAFGTLLDRFPRLELAVGEEDLRWRHSIVMRGLESLPVRVGLTP
jgi:cytochrome P450